MIAPPSGSPLGRAMRDALHEFGLERKIKEKEIFIHWEEIVGSAIARHSAPKRFAGGKLWIAVEEAAWRQELSLMRAELVAKINGALGMALVEEIVLR